MATQETPTLLSIIKSAADEIKGNIKTGSTESQRGYSKPLIADERSRMEKQAYMERIAQYTQGGAGNISTPPGFYSPFLTSTGFQVPNNRKEVYLWAAFFYDNDPKVAAGINFYTDFIFSGFDLECGSNYVKSYFEDQCKKLNFSTILPLISQEYHLRGDAFPFVSIDCKKCIGSNVDQESGEPCDHEGATWRSISLLDPNQVEVSPGFIDKDPALYFVANDDMLRIVQTGQPAAAYRSIPDYMRQLIVNKQPIPLDANCVYHFKRAAAPWSPYGTSIVRPLLSTLMYKDKLRQAQNTIADRLIIPVKIVKVGDAERPANEEDLRNVQDQLAARANDPLLTLVVHHAFDYQFVGANGQIMQVTGEHDNIENDLLDGLMLSRAVLSGEGPQYGGNMGLLAMDRRMERFRLQVKQWMEEFIFKPEAIRNGFIIENKDGDKEIIYPTVKWKDLQLRDETSRLQTLQSMQQSGIVSAESLIEAVGLDYDQEVERLRFEQNLSFGGGAGAEGGLGGGFGGAMGGFGAPGGGALGGEEMGGEMGGLGPELGGLGAEPVAGGIAPPAGGEGIAPPPATADAKRNNYRFASSVIYNMVVSQTESSDLAIPKRWINASHKAFYESLSPVTGRAWAGPLAKKFASTKDGFTYLQDGGQTCTPLNILAARQYTRTAAFKNKMIRNAAKKDEAPPPALFTKLERDLYSIILKLNIAIPFYAQYVAGPNQQYQLDAAFPSIKLGIEADSETFHAGDDSIKRDQERDSVLASQGWTILRFTDREIKKKTKEVGNLIVQIVNQLLINTVNPQNDSMI